MREAWMSSWRRQDEVDSDRGWLRPGDSKMDGMYEWKSTLEEEHGVFGDCRKHLPQWYWQFSSTAKKGLHILRVLRLKTLVSCLVGTGWVELLQGQSGGNSWKLPCDRATSGSKIKQNQDPLVEHGAFEMR